MYFISIHYIVIGLPVIMGDSKNELSTKTMLYSLKNCHITPLPPHNGHLSTTATFFCPQGGHCGEVQLYFTWLQMSYAEKGY